MATRLLPTGRTTALTGRRAECDVLDHLVEAVRAGESRALVVRGDPGVGKTALLDYLVGQTSGCRVVRAAGIQSELELAFAGLHQLLAPMLDRVDHLPLPQGEALRTAFGAGSGTAPDRFFVGLAVLNLFSDVAEEGPLVCVVDDEQWLDRASTQVLAFVARRLDREGVGIIFAARNPSDDLARLPDLAVKGLRDDDARLLLDSVLAGPLDEHVRDQIVRDARGNPLALLELLRELPPAELAGGFGILGTVSRSKSVEESFQRRLDVLPTDTRRLLQLASADPVGDPLLVWRAAKLLGIGTEVATPAVEAGLIEFWPRVSFHHPLVRSATYRTATHEDRQNMHRALAEVTDPEVDPDRRAWHRAHSTAGTDEDVAEELERSAGRAQARGGLAAAAAFLERSAMLTPEPARRAERLFEAARAKRDAGAPDAALGLLIAVEAGPPDQLRTANVEHLRGQIALMQRRAGDAARLLLSAARRYEPLNVALARLTHLEALHAAMSVGDREGPGGMLEAAATARAAPPARQPASVVDLLLDASAIRLTDGYGAAAPLLARVLEEVVAFDDHAAEPDHWLRLAGPTHPGMIALELWDNDAYHALAARQVRFAREAGALVHLQFALNFLAAAHLSAGELAAAAALIEEDHLIAEATGNPPIGHAALLLAAWRGQDVLAPELSGVAVQQGTEPGMAGTTSLATSVLCNAVGRHDDARDAAWRAFESDQFGFGSAIVPELAEAAFQTGQVALVTAALEWLCERTRITPTDWALGIEARVRALLSDGDTAERLHRESIEHLVRTRARVQVARAHLLYGEWLRRRSRRVDAREHLRTAHDMFASMGTEAFAERARRELLAAGETVRTRGVETRDELTAQETQIARLARDGLTNPEIGTRLLISPRTVQYHLSKVFAKLGISSRNQLESANLAISTALPVVENH